jgi:hypothetical protein
LTCLQIRTAYERRQIPNQICHLLPLLAILPVRHSQHPEQHLPRLTFLPRETQVRHRSPSQPLNLRHRQPVVNVACERASIMPSPSSTRACSTPYFVCAWSDLILLDLQKDAETRSLACANEARVISTAACRQPTFIARRYPCDYRATTQIAAAVASR